MAASTCGTSVQLAQAHRRKKKKNRPKQEADTNRKSDMELKGNWKVADVDYSVLKLDELHQFMGIEELSLDHDVVTAKQRPVHVRSKNRNKRHRKYASHIEQTTLKRKEPPTRNQEASPNKKTKTKPGLASSKSAVNPYPKKAETQVASAKRDPVASVSEGASAPNQRTKEKATSPDQSGEALARQRDAAGDAMGEDEDGEIAADTRRRKGEDVRADGGNQMSKKKASSFTKGIPVPEKDCNVDMSAWKNLHIPSPVLEALQDLGFKEPTPIQMASIPAAIKDRKDIVGAAETGSGKTLAFGIPVIHNILQHKAKLRREERSKAYKRADAETAVTTKPVQTADERRVTASATSPKKEQKTPGYSTQERYDVGSMISAGKRTKGASDKGMRTDPKREMETEDDDEEDEDYGEEMEDDEDNEDDEDIEYDLDEEDDDEDDNDDKDEDEDIDFEEDADGDEVDFGEDFVDEDDNKQDNQDMDATIKKTPNPNQKMPTETDTPADKQPKRRRGKKGQKKRRFRINERKMLELDGDEFEGVELVNKMEKRGFGCVRAIDDISNAEMLAQISSGQMVQQIGEAGGGSGDDRQLYAMILTPTRELAVQVKNHLEAVAKYTDIKVAVIVGGMSAQKQERVLKKRPEIVVGTPGRIWELFREGEPHLSTMSGVRCLVLDEADRMVEKGHYEQLTEILSQMNHSPASLQRQTFVFSATLALVHLGPDRKASANRGSKRNTPKQDKKARKKKLNDLMAKVGIRDDPAVVDLTQKQGTVDSLMEAKIICDITDKDIYLYYFLLQFPGRTLVFCNSIDCIRRLCSILTLLDCKPLPLNSSMHQKQRLKNMDRFAANPKALLLATDVAARGLDIPNIEHVVHYQVPRTSEIYIHRSGRTARQTKEGISVMLVSPTEANHYRRVCKTLNRDDITSFPVDHMFYNAVKDRVDLARLIDQTNHRVEKKKHTNDWFIKAAKELDVDLDEDLVLHDLGDSSERMKHDRKMQRMKGELKSVLRRTIFPRGSSRLYPTAAGKLISPLAQGSTSAFTMVKNKVGNRPKDTKQQADSPPKKIKKSKNKFKRNQDEKAT